MTPFEAHLVYAIAWLSFGLGHSLLAGEAVKARLRPSLGAGYRLAYNGFAVVHLGAIYAIGVWAVGEAGDFALPPAVDGAMTAVSVVGWLVLIIGLRGYDLGRLGGLRQLRNARYGIEEPEDEPLRRDGLHRYVRHPLYTGALLILWGYADDPLALATAVWGSSYLLIGTWVEERRLVRLYGDAYRDYRRRVPAFLPWRGRAI